MCKKHMTLLEREKLLKKILSLYSDNIMFCNLIEEYIFVSFCLDKNYQDIINVSKIDFIKFSENSKYIIYYAGEKTNNKIVTKNIKREFQNFSEIKKKVEKEKKYTLFINDRYK